MENKDIPKITKIGEVGDTPFQFIEATEKVLQGWNQAINRMSFLFKTKNNKWGYYDTNTKIVIEDLQWDGYKVLLGDQWIQMGLYHKIHIRFELPIGYTKYDKGVQSQQITTFGVVNITDSSFKELQAQMNGRDPNSFYQFTYKQGKKANYVVGAVWVK